MNKVSSKDEGVRGGDRGGDIEVEEYILEEGNGKDVGVLGGEGYVVYEEDNETIEIERDIIEENDAFVSLMENKFTLFIKEITEYLNDECLYEYAHQLQKINMYDMYNHMCYTEKKKTI